jgi:hypothetical protein
MPKRWSAFADDHTRLVLTPLGASNEHGLIPSAFHFLLVVSAKGTPARLLFLFGFGRMPRRTKTSRMTLSLAPWFRFLSAVINALAASSKLAFREMRK